MSFTILGMTSLMLYSSWNVWVLSNRSKKSMSGARFLLGLAYSLIMIVLLMFNTVAFLAMTILSILAYLLFGGFMEVFHPERSVARLTSTNPLQNYWTFASVDSAVALTSLTIMVCGGLS